MGNNELLRHPGGNETFVAAVQKKGEQSEQRGGVKHSLCVSHVKSGGCPINPDGDSRVNIYVHKPD